MEIVLPEFKNLLLLLVKHKVNFMLIGGYAVIYYGYERSTADMDIWLQPSDDNRDKLIVALREFGIGEESLNKVSTLDFSQIQFFFFGEKPRKIDFLTHINIVSFEDAAKEANYFPLKEITIPIIQYQHLILSKITSSRPQDAADVDRLQKINQFKNKK